MLPRRSVCARAGGRRQQPDWRSSDDGSSGNRSGSGAKMVSVRINGASIEVSETVLYGGAAAAAALLAGAALAGGWLVLTAAASALAFGAFFATAGVALTAVMLLPLLVFAGSFATFGFVLLGPVAITAALVTGGVLFGFGSAKLLASIARGKRGDSDSRVDAARLKADADAAAAAAAEAEAARREADDAAAAAQRELRLFDEQLRLRERTK